MESAGAIVSPTKKKNSTEEGSKAKHKNVKFDEGVPQPMDGISESETTSVAATDPISILSALLKEKATLAASTKPPSVTEKPQKHLTEAAGLPHPTRKTTLQQAFEEDAAESLAARNEFKESLISQYDALAQKIMCMLAEAVIPHGYSADTMSVVMDLYNEFDVCCETETCVDLQIMTITKLLNSLERIHEECENVVLVMEDPYLD